MHCRLPLMRFAGQLSKRARPSPGNVVTRQHTKSEQHREKEIPARLTAGQQPAYRPRPHRTSDADNVGWLGRISTIAINQYESYPRTPAQPSEGVTNDVRAAATRVAACRGPDRNNGSLCTRRAARLPLSILKRAKLALPGEGVG